MLQIALNRFDINEKTILKDISFELEDGENLTIMGANGAGKSTFAKVICALYKTKKSIKVDDLYIERISGEKRALKLNYIPPKFEIYDGYITVGEYLNLNTLKMSAKSALEIMGLESYVDICCKDLSSGEAQLLLIASALCHGAKITIFDEPVSNLDPTRVKKVFDILKSDLLFQKIVITHNLNFAYKLAYPVLYIKEGRAEFFKSSQEFFDKENLLRLFGDSVVKKDDFVVIEL